MWTTYYKILIANVKRIIIYNLSPSYSIRNSINLINTECEREEDEAKMLRWI